LVFNSSFLTFPGNFEIIVVLNPRNSRRKYSIMGKKLIAITLAVFAFAFGSALRANAGTEMIEPYRAPAPTYNYAPPPRPVFYVPPPVRVGVVVGPGYGYYGPRFGWYGPRRFYGRHASWRFRPHYWH
jgi:hypothetical protein